MDKTMRITNTISMSGMLIATLLISTAGCRYEQINNDFSHSDEVDPVDYVIAGDASAAAEGFYFPLTHNGFEPLLQIGDKSDFIRLFPVMFDKGVREELKRMKAAGGWNFRNWQGESYVDGAFWRADYGVENKITTVNITGEAFRKYYQKLYAKDLMNLAQEYRDGLAWVEAYFAAEDDSFYGRVDALGADERKKQGRVADSYRIVIFRNEQKPSEKPSEMYICKRTSDGIASEDGRVIFDIVYVGQEDSPWGWLTYAKDRTRGDNGYIRLKRDTPWLEKYKNN